MSRAITTSCRSTCSARLTCAPENTHVPNGANPDAQAACDAYEASILLAGGVDLQLLGLGHNGHIGFNEPAPEFPKEGTHCVDLTESTINATAACSIPSTKCPARHTPWALVPSWPLSRCSSW